MGAAESIPLCDCTGEQLEAGKTCGRPECPNRSDLIVVTGPKRVDPQPVAAAARALAGVREFISGGAHGADTYFALEAYREHPDARHTVVYPAAPWNEKLRDLMPDADFVAAVPKHKRDDPRELDYPASYLQRNLEMVQRGVIANTAGLRAKLIGFVYRPTYYRSGEWATIARARHHELPVDLREVSGR